MRNFRLNVLIRVILLCVTIFVLIYALQQAIKEYRQEGEQARYERITGCWEAIHKGLEEIGLGCVIDKEIQGHLVVVGSCNSLYGYF